MDENEIARRASSLPQRFADRIPARTREIIELMEGGGEYGELTIELTTSDPSNTLGGDLELVTLPLNWKDGETANHFTYLAFDRLMGWPVLASASGGR